MGALVGWVLGASLGLGLLGDSKRSRCSHDANCALARKGGCASLVLVFEVKAEGIGMGPTSIELLVMD